MSTWPETPLHDLVLDVPTWNPRTQGRGDISYVDIGSVDAGEKCIRAGAPIAAADAPSRARQLLSDGDVLVSTVRPNLNAVATVPSELDGATASTGFCVLRPDSARLCGRYLFHWVRSPRFVAYLVQRATGASYPAVTDAVILDSTIPLPPLDEQKRIAEVLDKADALQAKRRQAIAKLDTLLQAVFHDMVGNPLANPKGWSERRIDSFCRVIRGSSPRPKSDPRYYGGPVPRLTIADLSRDGLHVTPRLDSLTLEGAKRSRPVVQGTVVMAVSGDVGVVAQLAVPACIHDGFAGFVDLHDSIIPEYFLLCLHFMKAAHSQCVAGAIWQNTTTDALRRLKCPIPPLDIQRGLATAAGAITRLQRAYRLHQQVLDRMFSSVQVKVFGGEDVFKSLRGVSDEVELSTTSDMAGTR